MHKKISFFAYMLFFAIGLIIVIAKPFGPALDARAHFVIMMLVNTIGLWIFRPFNIPFSVSGIFFMAGILAAGFPASVVFSGFSGNAVWTLIPALFFGFALAETGLGRRIAYLGMKTTKLSYPGLLIMWTMIGIVLSLLTPSVNVRVVIITPIALNCVNILNLEKGSKERSLVLLSAWAMAIIPGTAWMTGSLLGPALSGFFSAVPELGAIDFKEWSMVSVVPIMMLSILTVITGYFALKPNRPLMINKEVFEKEYNKLGRISKQEKITGIILITAFVMFMTNETHHIPDAAVCMVALFLLSAARVIKANHISVGISWDLVIFIGTAMGFSAIFSYSKISEWLGGVLLSAISPICVNAWVFTYSLLIIMFIIRFLDIATFIPTMAILTSVIPQVAKTFGISPLVWIPLMAIAVNACFLSYQNMFALVAETYFKDNGWSKRHFSVYGCMYFISSMIAMLVAIPYWKAIGMFMY